MVSVKGDTLYLTYVDKYVFFRWRSGSGHIMKKQLESRILTFVSMRFGVANSVAM